MKSHAALLLSLIAASPAVADTHAVTVVNSGVETIRSIAIGPGTENRLRSQLPPGAQARVTYSTGCTADVRIGYDSGRTETFAGVDICSDPRIGSGQGVLGGLATAASMKAGTTPTPTPGKATPVATTKPTLPAVPPWTGKSITKRFGGMD